MSRDKPLWLGRGIKTATFQSLYLDICQHQLWFSPCLLVAAHLQLPTASAQQGRQSKTPKCWFQILSKWAVISHSDWGEASKLQHFKCSALKACMWFIKLWYDIWQPKTPKCWFQILSKWAVISWGEASKLQYFRGALFEDLHLPNQAAIWHSKAPYLTPDSL